MEDQLTTSSSSQSDDNSTPQISEGDQISNIDDEQIGPKIMTEKVKPKENIIELTEKKEPESVKNKMPIRPIPIRAVPKKGRTFGHLQCAKVDCRLCSLEKRAKGMKDSENLEMKPATIPQDNYRYGHLPLNVPITASSMSYPSTQELPRVPYILAPVDPSLFSNAQELTTNRSTLHH